MPVLRRIHRWLGLLLALPLLLQGISGAILALEPLLPVLSTAATQGEPRGAGTIIAAAQSRAPLDLRPVRYVPAATTGEAALVTFVPAAGPRTHSVGVHVDPVSLAVLDIRTGRDAIDWIRALHTNLLIEGRTGRSIIGWTGVGLLVLAVVGVALWWPAQGRWRWAFTIDPHAKGRLFHRRLHGAVGIWSLALLLITGTTGVLLAFPQTVRGALGVAETSQRRSSSQTAAQPVDWDRAIALAQQAAPGFRVRAVFLTGGADPLRVLLAPQRREGVAASMTVLVDGAGTRVLSVQDPATMPFAELALRWAHDLHFGQGLGPIWRGLTVLTGGVLPVFIVTGTALWLHRRHRRAPVLQPGE